MSEESPSIAYCWFDTEFTSLQLERSVLMQVALLMTDRSLQPLGEPVNLILRLPADETVSPWVEENLPELVRRCRSEEAIPLPEADQRLVAAVEAAIGPVADDVKARPVPAGNSLQADWWLARRDLPGFAACLHYRMLDVTALKLQWQDWMEGEPFDKEAPEAIRAQLAPTLGESLAGAPHDAFYDILASMAELQFYRDRLIRDPGARPRS